MIIFSHCENHAEKDEIPAGKRKSISKILTVCQLLLLAVLIVSFAVILKTVYQAKAEEKVFLELENALQEHQPDQTEVSETPSEQIDSEPEEKYTEYLQLYEMNHDFVGWLNIPGTEVNYPVMYTPAEPEYYLRRDFYKSDSKSGTPFVGDGASLDSDFCIIYGHYMKNKTMFGTLNRYSEKSFYEENPRFALTTVTERREYEIFAAAYSRVLYADEAGYRYYYQTGDLSEEEYAELVDFLKKSSAYDTGITPSYGEQIMVLSTCSYHTENGRFIVAARRIS